VSSPVIAIVASTLWSKARERSDVAIVTPADGPAKLHLHQLRFFLGAKVGGGLRCAMSLRVREAYRP
jgi:hypothetical protein